MVNLYLLNYNDYYNRIVKKEDTLAGYLDYLTTNNSIVRNINFVPNDDINTTLILNVSANWGDPDYVVVCDTNNEIISRWFVIDRIRKRNNQYEFSLKRDVIADNWSEVCNAPIYVNKAYLKDNDPMILNSEGMNFNQIKTSEHLLKNDNDFPWLAVYFTREMDLKGLKGKNGFHDHTFGDITYLSQSISAVGGTYDLIADTYNNIPFIEEVGTRLMTRNTMFTYLIPTNNIIDDENDNKGYIRYDRFLDTPYGDDFYYEPNSTVSSAQFIIYDRNDDMGIINGLINSLNPFQQSFINLLNDQFQLYDIETIMNLNGKVVKTVDTNKYYKYVVSEAEVNYNVPVESGSSLNVLVDEAIYNIGVKTTSINPANKVFDKQLSQQELINVNGKTLIISLHELITAKEFLIPLVDKLTSSDEYVDVLSYDLDGTNEAYDILMIPYCDYLFNDVEEEVLISKEDRMKIATRFIGSDLVIKDVQLLPYAPFNYSIVDNKIILNGNYRLQPIHRDRTGYPIIDYGIYLNTTQFVRTIEHNISYTDRKIANECDMYRLVSPNYNGTFEFVPTQFTLIGDLQPITTWNVDITLKPYQPYIHVYPNFSGLYGSNFGDARGLICEGDFSLSRLSDAFTTYALQNKNYDTQFKRQIKNMKTNYKLGLAENIVNGVGQSVGQGLAGGFLAGPTGAIAGAGAGIADTAGSAMTGYISYKEQKSFAKDNYNYNLQNIQAVPDTLTKVTAFNQNNKIFPFIEYYTCTDKEKEALRLKLKYDGYTVNRIDTINNLTKTIDGYKFIRGEVIRMENTNNDYHITNDIANELMKGVFLKWQ